MDFYLIERDLLELLVDQAAKRQRDLITRSGDGFSVDHLNVDEHLNNFLEYNNIYPEEPLTEDEMLEEQQEP